MASIFLGLDDPELTIPTPDELARTSAALFTSNTLVLHTNIGDIKATFDREHASETVLQVARFVLSGATLMAPGLTSKGGWLPDKRDEAIVFKVYDSEHDGRARFTPHTAFDDPTTAPGAAPRQSIEARAFAFF